MTPRYSVRHRKGSPSGDPFDGEVPVSVAETVTQRQGALAMPARTRNRKANALNVGSGTRRCGRPSAGESADRSGPAGSRAQSPVYHRPHPGTRVRPHGNSVIERRLAGRVIPSARPRERDDSGPAFYTFPASTSMTFCDSLPTAAVEAPGRHDAGRSRRGLDRAVRSSGDSLAAGPPQPTRARTSRRPATGRAPGDRRRRCRACL
jgi:hypothetical protein